MEMLGNFFGSSSSLVDGAKLVLIGGTIETARRVGQSAWSSFLSSFYLTAHFDESDYPFDWLQYWLIRQPSWRSSREFETTTRTSTTGRGTGSGGDELEDYNDDDEPDEFGKQKMKVVFLPTFDSTITIFYKNHWLRVRRWKNQAGSEQLSISVVARNNQVLKSLVLEAKKLYEADAEHRVNIYFADSHGSWRWTDSRTKRPMSSIVLNKGVKEMLLSDTRDFLKSEKWYADRGIPFRRGYLLHGVPGSGKTSLIHALAGALGLDIYVVSLSSSWINDATLSALMGRVPARCMVLLEDLDAAFTRSANRDDDSSGVPSGSKGTTDVEKDHRSGSSFSHGRHYVPDYNTLSLSGLLNSLDGVSAPEGRILFATTNHLERLDPALTRPGRMDVWVEFKHASKWQAELLFLNFFPTVDPNAPPPPTAEELAEMDSQFAMFEAQQEGGFAPKTPESEASGSGGAEAMAGLSAAQRSLLEPVFEPPPPPLDAVKLARLAQQFAEAIPENEHSVASLQGYLLKNKSRPEAAVLEAPEWVQSERELRARLIREKEERDARAAIEREKRKKEREEQKRRADREEARRQREEDARIRKEDEEYALEEKKLAEERRLLAAGLPLPSATPPPTSPATAVPVAGALPVAEAAAVAAPAVPAVPVTVPVIVAPITVAPVAAPVATPVAEAAPTPAPSIPVAVVDTDSEDGETPGAASIVLVKPETTPSPTIVAEVPPPAVVSAVSA